MYNIDVGEDEEVELGALSTSLLSLNLNKRRCISGFVEHAAIRQSLSWISTDAGYI